MLQEPAARIKLKSEKKASVEDDRQDEQIYLLALVTTRATLLGFLAHIISLEDLATVRG